MFKGFFTKRLSGKLLLITFSFVMIAEALIFIPSAAMFRQSWLAERAQYAGLLTLAIEGVPNYEGGEMLSQQFMHDTSVTMVRQKRMGRNQLVLGRPPTNANLIRVDLRKKRTLPLFRETFRDFFSDGSAFIIILSEPIVDDAELLEIMVPQKALKLALLDYSKRVLLWSLTISLLTGLFIYIALSQLIVRPVRNLAHGLKEFRKNPKKLQNPSHYATHEKNNASERLDEIGQLEREFVDMKKGVRHALKQQERLATLGMAMAKINHDLRNVLTSAGLISDRLAMEKDERIKSMGERLVRAVDRGVKLCEATLSFSQSVEDRPEPKDIHIASLIDEAAGDILSNLPARKGAKKHINKTWVSFENKVPHQLKVFADPHHSYRIFHNLFRNAAQAMQDIEGAKIWVEANISNDKAFIYIHDNGPGIPKSAKDDLFKAFTTAAKQGGTGLGLTISRELARGQGGNLSLEKTAANGTIFVVTFPLPAELNNKSSNIEKPKNK